MAYLITYLRNILRFRMFCCSALWIFMQCVLSYKRVYLARTHVCVNWVRFCWQLANDYAEVLNATGHDSKLFYARELGAGIAWLSGVDDRRISDVNVYQHPDTGTAVRRHPIVGDGVSISRTARYKKIVALALASIDNHWFRPWYWPERSLIWLWPQKPLALS